MSLELVNTFGTLLTVAIIAATAICRNGTAAPPTGRQSGKRHAERWQPVDDKAFRDVEILCPDKVASALNDPLYRQYELAISRNQPAPTVPEDYISSEAPCGCSAPRMKRSAF